MFSGHFFLGVSVCFLLLSIGCIMEFLTNTGGSISLFCTSIVGGTEPSPKKENLIANFRGEKSLQPDGMFSICYCK